LPVNAEGITRRSLLRWIGWFGAANAGLFAFGIARFFFYYDFPPDFVGNVYVILASVGQSAALACIPLFLVTVPVALAFPSRGLVTGIGVLISSVGLSLLFLDANVFAENRFHLSALTVVLFEWTTWTLAGLIFVILLVFETLLAGIVWRGLAGWSEKIRGVWVAAALIVCWLAGQGLHVWGDAVAHTPVTQFTRYLPLYYPIHAKRDLARLGLVDPEEVQKRRMLRGSLDAGSGQLRYPLSPLQCRPGAGAMPNILIVLVDALRPDAIHSELMPNIHAFGRQALRFNRHYSGGNSSRMGIFSLYYGLPSTYWQSFYDFQRGPVFMDQVRDNGFDVRLLSAVGFGSPTLIDRTVFAGWPDLPADPRDISTGDQNRLITDQWIAWLGERDTARPFFSFLYFDPPMWDDSVELSDDGGPLPMDDLHTENPQGGAEWRKYRLAMRTVDIQFGRIVAALSDQGFLDDTIVVLTSDHGYEFDDNGLGYIGHASNFSAVQLQATMLVHWPGKQPGDIDYRTSHHDVPVTFLQDVFGCENPPSDYSVGRNLFSGKSWDWMMAGSYSDHAIVEPGQVIVSYPGGFVEVRDADYRPVSGASLDAKLIQAAMEAQRRFYK
jgi:membrane-anchored protein YejM (alkaline phosphatase superfamily)